MDVWLTFAYISGGEVKNIACYLYTGYSDASEHSKGYCADSNAFAVDVTHIPTQIGDTYADGKFYRNGVEVAALPSAEQAIASHETEIDNLWIAVLEG